METAGSKYEQWTGRFKDTERGASSTLVHGATMKAVRNTMADEACTKRGHIEYKCIGRWIRKLNARVAKILRTKSLDLSCMPHL